MSALHWICALTLALVCSLSAQPVKRDAGQNSFAKDEIFAHLEGLKHLSKKYCPGDTKLYSPADIREDCLLSALNCTMKGLAVLQNDCELTDEKDEKFTYDKLNSGLDEAKKYISPSSSSCKVCESYPEKDVEQFLDAIKNLLERC